jgi:hypothetical protein
VCFALEAGAAFRIGGGCLWQNLDRDRSIQFGITRAIDLAHTAGSKWSEDLVRAEPRAGSKGHLELPMGARRPL